MSEDYEGEEGSQDESREDLVENDELDSSSDGFMQGYEKEEKAAVGDETVPADEEKLPEE